MSKPLRRQIRENFTLHDLLLDQGYKTYFVLSGNHDWHDLREMYGREHTLYFDGRDSTRYSRSDDRVIFEGLERVPDGPGPAFFYFHLMSAHVIGTKQDEYRTYNPSAVKNDWNALLAGEYDRETVVNNYNNGVRQALPGIHSHPVARLRGRGGPVSHPVVRDTARRRADDRQPARAAGAGVLGRDLAARRAAGRAADRASDRAEDAVVRRRVPDGCDDVQVHLFVRRQA